MNKELIINQIGGSCPVQAEGTIIGLPFYFRGRHNTISLCVGLTPTMDVFDDNAWYYEEDYGYEAFEAGWIPVDAALSFIDRSIEKFFEQNPTIRNESIGTQI